MTDGQSKWSLRTLPPSSFTLSSTLSLFICETGEGESLYLLIFHRLVQLSALSLQRLAPKSVNSHSLSKTFSAFQSWLWCNRSMSDSVSAKSSNFKTSPTTFSFPQLLLLLLFRAPYLSFNPQVTQSASAQSQTGGKYQPHLLHAFILSLEKGSERNSNLALCSSYSRDNLA